MEKKARIWLIVCGVAVAAAVVAIVLFLVLTRSVEPAGTEAAPKNIDGAWRVVAYNPTVTSGDNSAVYTPDQYITVSGGQFGYYQGATEIGTAKCDFKSGSRDYSAPLSAPHYRCTLTLTEQTNPALPGVLVVKYYTENTVELVDEAGGKEWRLVKLDGTRTEYKKADAAFVKRAWNVVLKGHTAAEVKLTFGESEVAIEGSGMPPQLGYTWNEQDTSMDIQGLGKAYVLRPSDKALTLVVIDSGNIITLWELALA